MKKCFRKLDNHGATLVFAIVTTVVILVLASLILSLAVSNFRVKATDYKTRQEFYTAEVAANELYSAVATHAIRILGESYESTLENVIIDSLEDQKIIYTDGSDLNSSFKEKYFVGVLNYLLFDEGSTGSVAQNIIFASGYQSRTDKFDFATTSPIAGVSDADEIQSNYEAYCAALKTKLRSFLSNKNAQITFVDAAGMSIETPAMYFDYASFAFVIENIHIEYNDKEYQSSQTFDLVIEFPDWNLNVAVDPNHLGNPYKDYGLIATKGIEIGDRSLPAKVTVNAGMYGGGSAKTQYVTSTEWDPATSTHPNGGIHINSSELIANPYPGAVVSRGDIIVHAASAGSGKVGMTLEDGSNDRSMNTIWCSNFIMDSAKAGAEHPDRKNTFETKGSNTALYVVDDMEIDSNNAEVTIKGNYIGFSANQNSNELNAYKSSAIIVNGINTKLNITNSANLYLAGKSYVNADRATANVYKTGESISIRADQKAYLVPNSYLPTGKTNPSSIMDGSYETLQLTDLAITDATIRGYLDASQPIVSKQGRVPGYDPMYYHFLNFKDEASAVEFAQKAITGTGSFAVFKDAVVSNIAFSDTEDNYAISINPNSSSTSGAVMSNVTGKSVTMKMPNSVAAAAYKELLPYQINDYANRFAIRSSLLVNTEGPEFYEGTELKIINDKLRPNSSMTFHSNDFTNSPMINYVKMSVLKSATYCNLGDETKLTEDFRLSDDTVVNARVYYRVGEDLVIDSSKVKDDSYLIAVVDGNVTISHSFKGLVIASGTITVTGNVTIDTDGEAIDKLLSEAKIDGHKIGEIFYYYMTTDAPNDDINGLSYSDVLTYSNWRKY